MPVGRPLDNYFVLVLDNERRPVAVGQTGELYIGGAGMTLGYHNRPALTTEAFVTSPYMALTDPKYKGKAPRSDLLYRTGDLMEWNQAGDLIYVGRTDSQVKVRELAHRSGPFLIRTPGSYPQVNGHRMELGEIESNVQSHSDVIRCIVMAREAQKFPGLKFPT